MSEGGSTPGPDIDSSSWQVELGRLRRDQERRSVPEDKDFKRLVRGRMARTGQRYTQAREALRPGTPPTLPPFHAGANRPQMPEVVLAGEVDLLLELRAKSRPHPTEHPEVATRERSTGSRWELSVAAGGPLKILPPVAISLQAVAALGASLKGVGYLAFGLDLAMALPEGAAVGQGAPPPIEVLRQAQAELLAVVRESGGLAMPPEQDPTVVTRHSSRTGTGDDGNGWLEARTDTAMMVRPGEEAVVDLGAVLAEAERLAGEPWAAYGVIVILDRAFPERDAPAGTRRHFRVPEVDREFWNQAGKAMESAAEAAGLPRWPLEKAWLQSLSSLVRVGSRYRPSWGRF